MCPSPASARTGRARLLTALPEVRVEPGRPPQRQVMVATRCPVPLSQSPALGLSWQIPKGRCWTWNLQANGLAGLSVLLEYGVVVKGGALARAQHRGAAECAEAGACGGRACVRVGPHTRLPWK